jgi:DNA adenine methylase
LVEYHEFVASLAMLNERGVPFIVSYDGRTGDKMHGCLLPKSLKLHRLEIRVGRSTQATLLGRDQVTVESLYLSRSLLARLGKIPATIREEPARSSPKISTNRCARPTNRAAPFA